MAPSASLGGPVEAAHSKKAQRPAAGGGEREDPRPPRGYDKGQGCDIRTVDRHPLSTFGGERVPPGFRDPDANDLGGLAACLDGLPLCCREPGTDEAGEHPACQSVGE
jgi:hypothetical protein